MVAGGSECRIRQPWEGRRKVVGELFARGSASAVIGKEKREARVRSSKRLVKGEGEGE